MPEKTFSFNHIIADNNDLRKTLSELRKQESELKRAIAAIRKNEIEPFNPLAYYEDNLESVKMLITNIRFYLKRTSGI